MRIIFGFSIGVMFFSLLALFIDCALFKDQFLILMSFVGFVGAWVGHKFVRHSSAISDFGSPESLVCFLVFIVSGFFLSWASYFFFKGIENTGMAGVLYMLILTASLLGLLFPVIYYLRGANGSYRYIFFLSTFLVGVFLFFVFGELLIGSMTL